MNYMQIGEQDTEQSPLSRAAEPNTSSAEGNNAGAKTWNRTNLLILIVSAFGLFFLASSLVRTSSTAEVMPIETKINGLCKDCTFLQCQRSMCDPLVAPMVCTSGAAHDGCADTALAWEASYVCDECCDKTECASTKPTGGEEDELPFKCSACTAKQCEAHSCPDTQQYVCLAGGATGGCTNDKYHWPTSLNNICNGCCDASGC